MRKSIITGICTLVMAVSLCAPASAAGYNDCQTQSAKESTCTGFNIEQLFSCEDIFKVICGGSLEDTINGWMSDWNWGGCAATQTPSTPEESDKEPSPSEQPAEKVPSEPDETEDKKPTQPETPEDNNKDNDADEQDDTFSAYATAVLKLINEERAAYGLKELTLSSSLCEVAQAKAQDMKSNNYFDHTSPTYGTPFQMMQSFGITYNSAGENIAMGYTSPEAVVNAWMQSAGHRANILSISYTQMGIGYVSSGNYWCQMFIG